MLVQWDAVKEDVVRDMIIMRTFGARVLRIMVLPECTGFRLKQGVGSVFTRDYDAAVHGLREFVKTAGRYVFKVIIAFGNDYYYWKGPDGKYWWELAYREIDGFLEDSAKWIQGFINATRDLKPVLYYDLQNEVTSLNPYMTIYVSGLLERVSVPGGKLSFSILFVPRDADKLAEIVDKLDYIDFHSYPTRGVNEDVDKCYQAVSERFSNAIIVLGEYGVPLKGEGGVGDEDAQARRENRILARLLRSDIAYVLHWGLWDNRPEESFGWGFDPWKPKETYSAMLRMLLEIAYDFEDSLEGWSAKGDLAIETVSGNGVGKRFLKVRGFSGVEVRSPIFTVSGDRLFLSMYLRGAGTCFLKVVFYNSEGRNIGSASTREFLLEDRWANIQYLAGPWAPEIPPGAVKARIVIYFNGAELWIDGVSIAAGKDG